MTFVIYTTKLPQFKVSFGFQYLKLKLALLLNLHFIINEFHKKNSPNFKIHSCIAAMLFG